MVTNLRPLTPKGNLTYIAYLNFLFTGFGNQNKVSHIWKTEF